jgi:hypothetical protein
MLDNSEDDDEDEPVDANEIYETGQIVSVTVENFMCHRKFTMDFGRRLNYINGRNGSGKNL